MSRKAAKGASWQVLVLVLFAFSVWLRLPYLGTLSDGHNQWLTAHSAVVIENWVQDGLAADKLLSPIIPRAIDHDGLADREVYVSYLPGAQLLVFPAAKLFPSANIFLLLQVTGLLMQLGVALVIFRTVAALSSLRQVQVVNGFAALAAAVYIFLPAPFYWHAMVYFADQAVILPFALALYLELRYRQTQSPFYALGLAAALCATIAMDYLAVPLVICLGVLRLAVPVGKHGAVHTALQAFVQLALPVLLPMLAYFGWVYHQGFVDLLIDRFLIRTGLGDTPLPPEGFLEIFFLRHMHIYFPLYIFGFAAVAWGFHRERSARYAVLMAGFCTVTLQVFLLRNHSTFHEFSVLKFFVPVVLTVFGFLPLRFLETATQQAATAGRGAVGRLFARPPVLMASMAAFAALLVFVHSVSRPEFPPPGVAGEEAARYIRTHAGYEDVLLGLDGFEIPLVPPQKLAIARKLVPKAGSWNEAAALIRNLPAGARLNVVLSRANACVPALAGNSAPALGAWTVIQVPPDAVPGLAECFN